mmetsp:Transcript_88089/g.254231  ORF Transcript_88089/g.254231 Transcript_88089/m.254231 type:complete len:677 (-) Transcript_88089:126-2156(-)
MRIFIHNVDTHLGKVLVDELRRNANGFNRVFGTIAKSADQAPKVVKRIVSRNDPKTSKKMIDTISSCRIVVIDLFSSTLEDLHFLIKALKVDPTSNPPKPTGELEKEVTVVLISSALVWANTRVDSEDGVIRETDYVQRTPKPGSKYEQWKEMENLVLNCFNREGSSVKALIVGGGVLYGEGENAFTPLFKDAWRGVQEHVILGNGKNRIPMVHVRDLARLVRQVGENGEIVAAETPYFLAIDQPPTEPEGAPSLPPTQAELVQGIVDEICDPYEVPLVQDGAWETPAGDDEEAVALRDLQEALTLDLVMAPSKHMLEAEFAPLSNPPGWFCRDGILRNIRKIAGEFCKERKLRAMRVLIGGPPASGKTTLAQNVSEHFKIPRLELEGSGEPEKMVETLSSRVCRYRGFVLDAGLSGFEEVNKLFRYDLEVPPKEGEEEAAAGEEAEDDEGRSGSSAQVTRAMHEDIIPSFVVITQAPRGLCLGRWLQSRGQGEEEEFKQRWQQYKRNNLSEMHSLADFFQEICKTSVFNIPIAGKDEEDLFESTRIYMEREGRPFNYLPTGEEVAEQILARIAEKEQKDADAKAAEQQGEDLAAVQLGESQRQERRLQIIQQHELEQQKLRELPLREYLMQYMIPSLTEGLIEVCKVLPENPADYLANVLEERAGQELTESEAQS